jgi:hypothetical protein
MLVSCECCVLSGRGLCDEPIPRPEESYRLWCVSQCDQKELKTSTLKLETGVGRRGRLKKKDHFGIIKAHTDNTTLKLISNVFSKIFHCLI